jgi:hypothetical protein
MCGCGNLYFIDWQHMKEKIFYHLFIFSFICCHMLSYPDDDFIKSKHVVIKTQVFLLVVLTD